ncbi:DUF1003 domain-containing protein [Tomitella fengzijianii]|uniref:DUF1003 domain-containing protein n=1 Tax=Tomitella fengzijianii TaxID=2597660 RepID=UPI00131C3C7B|nr:DUF1003 domain-containing protein [Tomitella fengzijianii]
MSDARTRRATGSQRLDTPRDRRRLHLHVDPEAAGRVSEQIARFFGTVRYLAIQTIVVVVWIVLNVAAVKLRWDPYPFILLNLAFSTQAAYAAPLILLAQNRQENRDRVSMEEDRARATQTKADTEFLARELAALRIAVGEVATRDYLRRELDDIRELLEQSAVALHADDGSDTARRPRDPGAGGEVQLQRAPLDRPQDG